MKYLTAVEVANELGYNRATIRTWLTNDKRREELLPGSYSVGEGRRKTWRVPVEAVEYLKANPHLLPPRHRPKRSKDNATENH